MDKTPPNAGVVTEEMVRAAQLAEIHWGDYYHERGELVSPEIIVEHMLDAAIAAAPQHECTIVHSEDPSAPAYLALGAVNVTRERCG